MCLGFLLYQAMLWMIRRGDTKDHPLTQWFLNFSEADELLKLAAARQQMLCYSAFFCSLKALDFGKAASEEIQVLQEQMKEAHASEMDSIKQLSFETETARREEKEMRSKTQELKQEAEKSKAVAKELEKKLELYLQQAEGAKASE
ncbi:hypothetical protein JHK86_007032 [Glycine max]|nr:hypothetical protein JHK86_007032 [Glycine max]